MSVNLLIVDDDQINAKLLSKRLSKRGFIVTCVDNGQDCLDIIFKSPPDLVLLDNVMPELSGLEVLRLIRAVYSTIRVPVIMMTANTEVSDLVTALKDGANDYILKPVNIDIAEARIISHVEAGKNYQSAMVRKEIEAQNSMIAFYNHEINNPLTIALGYLRKSKREKSLEYLDRIQEALTRVSGIVKEIEKITEANQKTGTSVAEEAMPEIYKIK